MTFLTPMEIEAESFRLIREELGTRTFPEKEAPVVQRVIHTTADFSYADTLRFSPHACDIALDLLQNKPHIVTDTTMARSGINQSALDSLGASLHCFIADPQVAEEAKQRNLTRSWVAVEKALSFSPLIYVVGNAPTALLALHQQITEQGRKPDFIIAVPVGFVNVVESKELILQSDVPHIVAEGRKGGSNVAAAIVNSLVYQLTRKGG